MSNTVSKTGVGEHYLPLLSKENHSSLLDYLQPESSLEKELLKQPDYVNGLFWGVPRFGHPEGKVVYHIREVLNNIDKLNICPTYRNKLRLAAFVHDSFKNVEHRGTPRDWTRHHAVLARNFMENFSDDKLLLDLIEFHDEAYHIWLALKIRKNIEVGTKKLEVLKNRFADNMQLYYLFFKCDTETGDKNPAPVKWFEETFENISVIQL